VGVSLRIDLQTSRILSHLLLGQVALALVAILLLAADSPFALLLLLPVGAGAHFLRNPPVGPRALVLMGDEWYLVYQEEVAAAVLKDEFHCTSWLQILEFQVSQGTPQGNGSIFVPILPDSASVAERRELRSILRWYRFARGIEAQE